MKYFKIALIIGALTLLADYVSKSLIHQYLPLMQSYWQYPYGGIPVFKNFLGIEFSISHQINRGAAWGILAHYQVPLLYLRIFLIFGVFVYLVAFNRHRSWTIPLMLILAGALGNVIDYFLYGHVIDMFHFVLWGYEFPVFNIADTAIFIGISSLLIISTFQKQHIKDPISHD